MRMESEFPYMYETFRGDSIVAYGMDAHGFLTIIAEDSNFVGKYLVAHDYRPRTGHWGHGDYMLTYNLAIDILREDTRYPFSPNDPRAVEFMRNAMFNYWHVDKHYLKDAKDFRDLDAYRDRKFVHTPEFKTREEYDSFREDYILRNPSRKGMPSPRRSVVVKSSEPEKPAQNRRKFFGMSIRNRRQ